ncbi:hypothetical protein JCM12298_30730 [Desulfothermus naphthae]
MEKEKLLSSVCTPLSMIVHAMASQPAKNAGALVAVNAISDAIPIIHGPFGCAALRKINSFSVYSLFPRTPCTNMKEIDLVYGAEKKLKRAIIEAYKRYKPSLIVVIPTCPSDMIADDIASAAHEAKKEVRCKVVYSTGELIKGRPIGYHDAVYSILDQLLPEGFKTDKKKDSVNLITFPFHSSENRMDEFQDLLEEIGIKVNRIFFYRTKVEDIFELPKAELNIADSSSPWLKLMEKRFGIPSYVVSSIESENSSYGIEETSRILLDIASFFGKKEEAKKAVQRKKEDAISRLEKEIKDIRGMKIAIVGGLFFGIGSVLVKELGLKPALLIYSTYGLESHGMSKDAIKKLIERDREVAERCGIIPEVLVNSTYREEIKKIKELNLEFVVGAGPDIAFYHKEGIKAFDSLKLHSELKIGFETPIFLARLIKREMSKEARKSPILGMIEHDPYRAELHPSWIKAEKVWRMVTEGADGGCLYG